MAIRNACVVWTRRPGEDWETDGREMSEREACKEASRFKDFGFQAKSLPLGTKPKTETAQ